MSSTARALSDRLARMQERLRDPEWRRYGYLLYFGKALGLACLFGMIFLLSSLLGDPAGAADAPPVLTGNDVVNPLNTVWTFGGRLPGVRHQVAHDA